MHGEVGDLDLGGAVPDLEVVAEGRCGTAEFQDARGRVGAEDFDVAVGCCAGADSDRFTAGWSFPIWWLGGDDWSDARGSLERS